MRPMPPKIFTDWQELVTTPPPQCCHTCEKYNSHGYCKVFCAKPPIEFTQKVNECEHWESTIPFF